MLIDVTVNEDAPQKSQWEDRDKSSNFINHQTSDLQLVVDPNQLTNIVRAALPFAQQSVFVPVSALYTS